MYMNGIQAKTSNIPLGIRLLLPIYKLLQQALLVASILFLIYMRVHGQIVINKILSSWRWDLECKKTFWSLSGIAYAFCNFGFVNYFLTGDALRKISKRGTSVRVSMKLALEFLLVVVDAVIIYTVFINGIVNDCGPKDQIAEVKTIFLVAACLFTPYLFSFIIYSYLRWVLKRNEKYRAIYDNFLKSKYA